MARKLFYTTSCQLLGPGVRDSLASMVKGIFFQSGESEV